MAGSERVEGTRGEDKKKDQQMDDAIAINSQLSTMGRVIDNITRLKKLLTGGETIPNNTGWRETPLT